MIPLLFLSKNHFPCLDKTFFRPFSVKCPLIKKRQNSGGGSFCQIVIIIKKTELRSQKILSNGDFLKKDRNPQLSNPAKTITIL